MLLKSTESEGLAWDMFGSCQFHGLHGGMASPTGRHGGQEFCSGLAPGPEGEMLRIMTYHDFPHHKDLQVTDAQTCR